MANVFFNENTSEPFKILLLLYMERLEFHEKSLSDIISSKFSIFDLLIEMNCISFEL